MNTAHVAVPFTPAPCPFCGSVALEVNDLLLLGGISRSVEFQLVRCQDCDAAAPVHVWNTRATSTAI
jgi:hypothetical protein